MKTEKLILINVLAFMTSILVLYLYFGSGAGHFALSKGYLLSVISPFLTILTLFIITLCVNISYVAVKAKTRKNLLRASMLVLIVMVIISIAMRVIEVIRGSFCLSCFVVSGFYLVLLGAIIFILKDLNKLIEELSE